MDPILSRLSNIRIRIEIPKVKCCEKDYATSSRNIQKRHFLELWNDAAEYAASSMNLASAFISHEDYLCISSSIAASNWAMPIILNFISDSETHASVNFK